MYLLGLIFLFTLTVSGRYISPRGIGNLQSPWQNGTGSPSQPPVYGTGMVTSSPSTTPLPVPPPAAMVSSSLSSSVAQILPAPGSPNAPGSTSTRKTRCKQTLSTSSTPQALPASTNPQVQPSTSSEKKKKCSGRPPTTNMPQATPASSTPAAPPMISSSQAPALAGNDTGMLPAASSTTSAPPQFFTAHVPTLASSLRTYTPQSAPTGASGCPPQMKAVTFNGGMNPGMFDTIGSAENWITFQPTIPNGPASPNAAKAFIPMMAFATDVQAAIDLVNGPNPPAWMLTFNEPDFSYNHATPTMSPQEAANAIAPLIAKPGKGTKFVAPVPAFQDSDWLDQFYAACNCKDFFSAYNIHQYAPDSATVTAAFTKFHEKYPDKPIWVTEVAPGNASPVCSLSQDQVATFMNDIYRFAAKSGFIDRVFWNTGNQIGPGDTNVCNSYLMTAQGGTAPLLQAYQQVDCS